MTLRCDVKSCLEELKTKTNEKQQTHVLTMINVSQFYYENANSISQTLAPNENENYTEYAKRLKTKEHKNMLKKICSVSSHIESITLIKPDVLHQLHRDYVDLEKIRSLIKNICKMHYEVLTNAYTTVKPEKYVSFFNGAFCEGCINKKTTKLSDWMSKNTKAFRLDVINN